jgi:Uri superfamily endonuclease
MCFLAGLVHNLIPYDPLVKAYIVYVKLSCMTWIQTEILYNRIEKEMVNSVVRHWTIDYFLPVHKVAEKTNLPEL